MNRAITQILYEVAEIIMGQSPESESYNDKGDGIPFYQGKSDFGEVYPTVRMYCTSPKKIAMANDILMSVRAPIGDVNIAREKCCIGRGLAAIRPRGENNLKYLFYLLDYYKERLAEQGTGSTFKAVGKDILKEFKIPVWNLEKQQMIADIVDEIQQLIFIRREALSVLDELVKSRFVEMFGDMRTNPMGWRQSTVGKECYYIKDGPHKSPSYVSEETGIPFISTRNIVNGSGIDWSTAKYISKEDYDSCVKKCYPQKGDILYSKGGTTGIAKLVDTDRKFANWVHVAVLKFRDNLDGKFFESMLNMDYCYAQSQRLTKGIVNKDFVLSAIAQVKIFVPPKELQIQYRKFVEQADKSKLSIQQSIETLQTLKAKLMQEYFG